MAQATGRLIGGFNLFLTRMESADKPTADALCSVTAWNSGIAVLAGSAKTRTGRFPGVGVACVDGGTAKGGDAAGLEPSEIRREHLVGSQCSGVRVGRPRGG